MISLDYEADCFKFHEFIAFMRVANNFYVYSLNLFSCLDSIYYVYAGLIVDVFYCPGPLPLITLNFLRQCN